MSSPHDPRAAAESTSPRTDGDTMLPAQPASSAGGLGETLLTCVPHSPPGSAMPALAEAPLVQVPGYAILAEVGRGGMGVVYKARQLKADRVVALKMILSGSHAGAGELSRFRTEAEALARLQHPNIVGVYDVGEHEGRPFFSLEYCPGGSLDRKLDGTPLPPPEAASLIAKLAQAMAAAHDKGVIHRDLKPANVLMAEDGTPKITDFGLAKKLDDDSGQTGSGTVMGTPSYMAPEQAIGKARELGPACDIYALGAVLYECLTGRPPFRAATAVDTLMQVVHDEPVPPSRLQPKCPRDLETVCLKCLHKDPARRYSTASALSEDCAAYLDGRPIRARAVGRAERLGKWVRRRPATAALIVVSAAALLALYVGGLLYQIRLNDSLRQTERERQRAVGHLYEALIGEAQGLRLARSDGYRNRAWNCLERALRLGAADCDRERLSLEAAACLGDPAGREPMDWPALPGGTYVFAVHPDGDLLAAGRADGSVRLYRRITSAAAGLASGPSAVTALSFAKEGRLLICVHQEQGSEKNIRVWEQRDGAWELRREFAAAGFFGDVSQGAAGALLAMRSRQKDAIQLWNLDSGEKAGLAETPADHSVIRVALGGNGKRLAAGYKHGSEFGVLIWDLPGMSLRPPLARTPTVIHAVAFSPDGDRLAYGTSAGMTVCATDSLGRLLFVGGDMVRSIAFGPAEDTIAMLQSQTGIVRLWNLRTNREIAAFRHPAGMDLMAHQQPAEAERGAAGELRPAGSLSFTADGSLVLASDRTVQMRGMSGGAEKLVLASRTAGIPDVAFHPDSKVLAAGCKDRTVTLWDTDTGKLRLSLPMPGIAQNALFSPDGRLLAVSDWAETVQLRDARSGKVLATAADPPGTETWSLSFSRDGRLLAASGKKGVRLWQVKQGDGASASVTLESRTVPRGEYSRCVCLSPDGRWLVWNEPKALRVWDAVRESEAHMPIAAADFAPRSIGFLPDGRLVLASGGEVHVWNLGERRRDFLLGGEEFTKRTGIAFAQSLAVSRDGTRLAVTGDRITIWDVPNQKLLLALPRGTSAVWGLGWSHDNELLATGSVSGALAIWRLETGPRQLAGIGLGW